MMFSFCNELIVFFFEGNLYISGEIGKVDYVKVVKYFIKVVEKG